MKTVDDLLHALFEIKELCSNENSPSLNKAIDEAMIAILEVIARKAKEQNK